MLYAVSHELDIGAGNVGDADVLTHHHQVVDIDRIQTAKWNCIGQVVARIPDLVLETKVVFAFARFLGTMETECTVVVHNCIFKFVLFADVGFS